MKQYTIKEWDCLDIEQDKVKTLLYTHGNFFNPNYKNGSYRAQAKHYVGTIVFKDDTVIEILPKINENEQKSKKLLEKMIRTIYSQPKYLDNSFSDTVNESILEFFIKMFYTEAKRALEKGVSHGYSKKEENSTCVKGKILFNKDIKKNIVNHSKTYINHEIYSDDRPENRIILKTAKILKDITKNSDTKHLLSIIINSFEETITPINAYQEFRKCTHDRSVQHYNNVLDICQVLLNGCHSIYSGNHISISLLFDMNKLYEKYITYCIKINYPGAKIFIQNTEKRLFNHFKLKPDLVVAIDKSIYVLDTKWKIIEKETDINESDAYQMFTYLSKYENCNKAYLLYPRCTKLQNIHYRDDSGTSLHIVFTDLFNEKTIIPIVNE